ncbi:T-cell surface glycoprotein CD3 zeta chain isoform X2 [Eumetopias jubatus]|uniref:T-cell surface glycoprotein CD3 zeta chain isoform X2 n=1 Tax=Eumetopias jubatus TaxID=34886 RepID=UPI001016A699|nr:T-cell surface glycoprotein CD3 zeta chain isoform X2 [Eumetopias jubatus]
MESPLGISCGLFQVFPPGEIKQVSDEDDMKTPLKRRRTPMDDDRHRSTCWPPTTGAQSFGLLDPKLCYLLDGILFIYGIILTALFLRAKFCRSAAAPQDQQDPNQLYNELNLRGREEYEVLDKRRGLDPEMGGKQRKRNPPELVYNALQKDKMAEAYSEIGIKGENQRRRGKGHDGLYQGLSTATKDTYDALHMQTLPPR